jgi:hypothetical protein
VKWWTDIFHVDLLLPGVIVKGKFGTGKNVESLFLPVLEVNALGEPGKRLRGEVEEYGSWKFSRGEESP